MDRHCDAIVAGRRVRFEDELLVLTDNQLIFEPHTPPSDDGITVTIHAEVTSTGEADRDNVILTTQLENGN